MKETLKIEIPVYRTRLHVFFGSLDECAKAMSIDGRPEHYIEDWKQHTEELRGMYSQDGDYRLLWLPMWPKSVDDYGCMVHEIWHAVFHILQSRGLRHSEDSDEAYAYLAGYLFSEIDAYVAEESERMNNARE